MIYHFKTLDEEIFVVNTGEMKWGRASTMLAAPSISAVEHKLANYVFAEEGVLAVEGHGRYLLVGRTEKSTPGNGLCAVGILTIPYIDKFVVGLAPNVPVKEGSFELNMPEESKKYYHCYIEQPKTEGAPQVTPSNEQSK